MIAVSYNGKTQVIDDLINPLAKKINTNLKESDIYSVLDIAYVNDEIFIATSNFRNGITDCSYFELLKAKFNKINLAFKNPAMLAAAGNFRIIDSEDNPSGINAEINVLQNPKEIHYHSNLQKVQLK